MLLQLPSSLSRAVSSLLHPSTPEGASAGAELVTSDGRTLPLVSARLVGEAQGGIARLVLEQMFKNAYAENLRVTYRMPLPADGAVSGYEFVIGDRVVVGSVDRKARARERFETAIASGKTAALLEQERADIFTQQIGNIPPGESVLARITIDQRLVWLPEGEWELRFPTVIGPRYIGTADTAADVRATHIKVTDKPLSASVQIGVAIKDAISGGGKPSSSTHQLSTNSEGVTELASGARLDRDIVLRWPVAAPAPGVSIATAARQQGAFGLLTIVPPSPKVKPTPVPRDLIVLLDTSGSMGGAPLDKAKQVISLMIDSLGEQDRFELIEFNYAPTRYNAEPLVATASAKQAAIRWVRSREADGGTEMRAGVIEAMQTLRIGAQRQIVVVTDGYVGGERQILEAINRRLPRSCRLHVLGVGSAVNRSLASALARAGRGAEVLVGPDEDAERSAKRLLDRTKTPLLTNVEITGSAVLRQAPDRIPDVFERAPLVAALAIRPEGGQLCVRGQLGTEDWEQTIDVPAVRPGEGNGAILALYGRERVADVESNALFGSVDGEIEELGLTFQIATRMTSWIAIDETRKVTGPTRDELVPQELPYGTSAGAFGLRAASSPVTGRMRAQVMLESSADMSFSPPQYDADDIGESAPSEIFGEDEEVDALSQPAFDRSVRTQSGVVHPTPALRKEMERVVGKEKTDLLLGGGGDDDFESESSTDPSGAFAPLAGKPTAPPPLAQARAPEPEMKRPRPTEAAPMPKLDAPAPMPKQEAPAPVTTKTHSMPSSHGYGAPDMKPQPPQGELRLPTPLEVPVKARSKVRWWMVTLVLAIIALLMWWLLA